MSEAKPFSLSKLVCGILAAKDDIFSTTEEILSSKFGSIDSESSLFDFDTTDYYAKQMGGSLKRKFISFARLVSPDQLSDIKIFTNSQETEIMSRSDNKLRVVNIDPGVLNAASLVMGTVKDFAHRIPLRQGIYAHLEFLFGRKNSVRLLPWTYPDLRKPDYQDYFLEVRKIFLTQIKNI